MREVVVVAVVVVVVIVVVGLSSRSSRHRSSRITNAHSGLGFASLGWRAGTSQATTVHTFTSFAATDLATNLPQNKLHTQQTRGSPFILEPNIAALPTLDCWRAFPDQVISM